MKQFAINLLLAAIPSYFESAFSAKLRHLGRMVAASDRNKTEEPDAA
jgi:hypothetical protein